MRVREKVPHRPAAHRLHQPLRSRRCAGARSAGHPGVRGSAAETEGAGDGSASAVHLRGTITSGAGPACSRTSTATCFLRSEGPARETRSCTSPATATCQSSPRSLAFDGTPLDFLLEELGSARSVPGGTTADICVFGAPRRTPTSASGRRCVPAPSDCVAAVRERFKTESLHTRRRATFAGDLRTT